jgi:hypothetical protein
MNQANRKILLLPLLLLSSVLPGIAFAGGTVEIIEVDVETTDQLAHGEEAHKNHCYKCHTDSVYTRDDRFVKSIDALSKQVVRCKDGSNIPWFDEDSDAVVQFLNKKYYRF